MTKNNQKNVNNRNNNNAAGPKAGDGTSSAAAPMGDTATAHNVVSLRAGKGAAGLFWDEAETSQETGNKLTMMQEATQLLAHAQDLFSEGTGKEAEANEIAARAGLVLSTLRLTGAATQDEISAKLIDIFGAKAKADGTPSKTPLGRGEYLRKRIQRMALAQDYVNGDAQDGFFKGCPKDEVADILHRINAGTLGFWAGYEEFAALKKAQQVTVPLAFNTKRIVEIAETLQKDGSAKQFVSNPALRKAYSSLWRIMEAVALEARELADKAA